VKNDAITSGTEVNTAANSYAVLIFEDGLVATLQENTAIHFKEYLEESKGAEKGNIVFWTKKSNIIFSEFTGGMRFITSLNGQRNHTTFRLSTPNATIGIQGAEFLVTSRNNTLYSQVISGSISMTNEAGVVVFTTGQIILAVSPNTLPKAIPFASLPPGIFSQLDAIPTIPATTLLAQQVSAGAVTDATTDVSATGASAATSSAAVSEVAFLEGKPSARTVSITGSGATYTGANLPCDFCTGRTNTVATHTATDTATDGTVTGDAILFGKHNLTDTGANTGEICAFCHTPQGDESNVSAPRWNRMLTTMSAYRAYSSLGSATPEATGSVSMSCLSCHDGSQAPNIVINTPTLQLDVGAIQVDTGNDLLRHHPVGVQYGGGGQDQYAPDTNLNPLAAYDRNLVANTFAGGNKFIAGSFITSKSLFRQSNFYNKNDEAAMNDFLTLSNEGNFNSIKGGFNKSTYSGTGSGTVWWVKSPNSKIGRQKTDLYLFTRTDKIDSLPDESLLNRPYVECATCHDPHSTNPTFLRMPGGNARSQICLACHNK